MSIQLGQSDQATKLYRPTLSGIVVAIGPSGGRQPGRIFYSVPVFFFDPEHGACQTGSRDRVLYEKNDHGIFTDIREKSETAGMP
jgi:hypothetical protein